MKRYVALVTLLIVTCGVFAQSRVDIGPVELIMPGAPELEHAPSEPTSAASWTDALTPAIKFGLIMIAVGVPMVIVILGRLWHRLPEGERVLVLLCVPMGRGRGFRARVRSLAASSEANRRGVSPVAMLLAPRAFDAALNNATHAERAFGQPLRHAVHGFRKG